MRIFEIANAVSRLRLKGHKPQTREPYLPWEYELVLTIDSLKIKTQIADHAPDGFVHYFKQLEEKWQGWSDPIQYQSLNQDLTISATHDGSRSVSFLVTVSSEFHSGLDWSATAKISVEPAYLSSLAMDAIKFAG